MNFFDSSEDTSYEVKDPDLLRMQSQNEKLKEALDEANQTVKQIQNVFTAQTVSFMAISLRDPRIYWSANTNFSIRGSLTNLIIIRLLFTYLIRDPFCFFLVDRQPPLR